VLLGFSSRKTSIKARLSPLKLGAILITLYIPILILYTILSLYAALHIHFLIYTTTIAMTPEMQLAASAMINEWDSLTNAGRWTLAYQRVLESQAELMLAPDSLGEAVNEYMSLWRAEVENYRPLLPQTPAPAPMPAAPTPTQTNPVPTVLPPRRTKTQVQRDHRAYVAAKKAAGEDPETRDRYTPAENSFVKAYTRTFKRTFIFADLYNDFRSTFPNHTHGRGPGETELGGLLDKVKRSVGDGGSRSHVELKTVTPEYARKRQRWLSVRLQRWIRNWAKEESNKA